MESGYYERLSKKGFLKPEDIEPDVGGFEFYLMAFTELSTCRVNGMAQGPIPFTAIVKYAEIYWPGDFDAFVRTIRRMDSAYLKAESKKTKREEKPTNGANPSTANPNRSRHKGKPRS